LVEIIHKRIKGINLVFLLFSILSFHFLVSQQLLILQIFGDFLIYSICTWWCFQFIYYNHT
jgi:hypothetical protein